MKKKIVIHAGPGKTGTSAVQYWLNQNNSFLVENGIFYPSHKVDVNKISCGNIQSIYDKKSRGYVLNQDSIARLMESFTNSSAHTLLLSSELFFSRIDELLEHFPDATVVLYFRNTIELAESIYNQHVKRKRKISKFDISLNFGMPILGRLDELLKKCGNHKIVIKPYLGSLFKGGSIVSDLLAELGVELDMTDLAIVNPSYTFEALEFMRHLNHFDFKQTFPQIDKIMQGCSVGRKNYSLIPRVKYKRLTNKMLDKLQQFSINHGIDSLDEYICALKTLIPRNYIEQRMTRRQLMDVANYIKNNFPGIYTKMAKVVLENKHIKLPEPAFYECFEN